MAEGGPATHGGGWASGRWVSEARGGGDLSYEEEEEDTCVSYEEQEEDTCVSYDARGAGDLS